MEETTLKLKAYQEIKEWILHGSLKPGDFITERSLAEKLKMSRTPIRSAVERLESDGLLRYTPNKGIFISEMTLQNVSDFYDFRMAIEPYVVKKLSEIKLSNQEAQWFKDNLDKQNKSLGAKNFELFTELDSEYHLHLISVYGNDEITRMMERLDTKLYQVVLKVLRKESSRIQTSYNDHIKIFESICKGDAVEAVRYTQQHLEFCKTILIF